MNCILDQNIFVWNFFCSLVTLFCHLTYIFVMWRSEHVLRFALLNVNFFWNSVYYDRLSTSVGLHGTQASPRQCCNPQLPWACQHQRCLQWECRMSRDVAVQNDVIKWKHFPRNWPFVRGLPQSRWIPRTYASDAELWCFLLSTPD